jgi:hypothetical protein
MSARRDGRERDAVFFEFGRIVEPTKQVPAVIACLAVPSNADFSFA